MIPASIDGSPVYQAVYLSISLLFAYHVHIVDIDIPMLYFNGSRLSCEPSRVSSVESWPIIIRLLAPFISSEQLVVSDPAAIVSRASVILAVLRQISDMLHIFFCLLKKTCDRMLSLHINQNEERRFEQDSSLEKKIKLLLFSSFLL